MTKRRIRVMLLGPLPPPVGGIATWTTMLLRTPVDPDIERIHVNTSVGVGYGLRLTPGIVIRRLRLATNVLWRIIVDRPDVIHVPTSYLRGWRRDMVFVAAARMVGSKAIIHLRGGDFGAVFRRAAPGARQAMRQNLERCACVVAITHETATFLTQLGLTNAELIPNCIDIREDAPRSEHHGPVRWLFVGHVTKLKGVAELFAALRRFPNAHLTLVGPAPEGMPGDGAELLASAVADPELAGRITHTPEIAPALVRTVYRNHDLFVFPTRREGFPNAVLEAMEAGLPIVATRVGAIPDMIVDGEHGLLVDSGDPVALERAIARVSADTDLAARMGEAARVRVKSRYEVGRVASTWYELYRSISASTQRATAD